MTIDLPPINPVVAAGGLLVIAAALSLLWRPIRRIWRRIDEFLVDWNGQPGRPGVERQPGMMEWRAQVTQDVIEIKAWAGNGINSKVETLTAQTVENHAVMIEHIESADRTSTDLADRIDSLAEDVAESRDQATNAARLAGDTAVVAARELQKISERIDGVEASVHGLHLRFDVEVIPTRQENEAMRATLTEMFRDEEPPRRPHPPAA